MNSAWLKTNWAGRLLRCRVVSAHKYLGSLESQHEPSRQETSPSGGRSPQGRASVSGLAGRAAAAPERRQRAAASPTGGSTAHAKTVRGRARESRRRAASLADKGPD